MEVSNYDEYEEKTEQLRLQLEELRKQRKNKTRLECCKELNGFQKHLRTSLQIIHSSLNQESIADKLEDLPDNYISVDYSVAQELKSSFESMQEIFSSEGVLEKIRNSSPMDKEKLATVIHEGLRNVEDVRNFYTCCSGLVSNIKRLTVPTINIQEGSPDENKENEYQNNIIENNQTLDSTVATFSETDLMCASSPL